VVVINSQLFLSLLHCYLFEDFHQGCWPFLSTKTYGVFGMKERASILGGSLQINNNAKEKGTTVNLLLPQKNMTVAHD
jgi:glucose-6-phosphate-specific signal transduction histidine kinase